MNYYYLEEIERYIEKLKSESFEGWCEDEIKGYLTACESIKQKVKKVQNEARLDSMEEEIHYFRF